MQKSTLQTRLLLGLPWVLGAARKLMV
jgi:hypothetical protein